MAIGQQARVTIDAHPKIPQPRETITLALSDARRIAASRLTMTGHAATVHVGFDLPKFLTSEEDGRPLVCCRPVIVPVCCSPAAIADLWKYFDALDRAAKRFAQSIRETSQAIARLQAEFDRGNWWQRGEGEPAFRLDANAPEWWRRGDGDPGYDLAA